MSKQKIIFIFVFSFLIICYRFYDCYFNNYCGLTKTTKIVEKFGTEFNLTISFLIVLLIISILFLIFFLKKGDEFV